MRKKLSVYFDNEDEAMNAATKLRAAGAAILSVEEVDDDDPHDFLPINAAWLGGFQNNVPLAPNLFYPFEAIDEEFGIFNESFPPPNNRRHKTKTMVRFAVGKEEVGQAMKIVTENRGRL